MKLLKKEAGEYFDHYEQLVELERKYEMKQYEAEMQRLSGRKREEKGRALIKMRAKDEGEGLEGYLVKFMRMKRGRELGETEIAVGDLVMVSKKDPLRDDNPTGTVTEKTNYSLIVAFEKNPPGFVYGKWLRVDLYVNDITYQRMKDALGILKNATGPLAIIRDICRGIKEIDDGVPTHIASWKNPSLNRTQKKTVKRALSSERIHLIHGPPGTGKTTTLIEIILQLIKRNKTVLVTAASNKAVDNILEFLLEYDVDVVRVGHPARVTHTLREHTLDSIIKGNEKYKQSRVLRERAFVIKERQEKLIFPSPRYRRGMSDSYIKKLAGQKRGSRGVSPHRMKEMADWIKTQEKVDNLFEESDKLEKKAVDEVISSADVICTTNSTAGSELMEEREFDVVVIDEATQAIAPSCFIPMIHADKVIMAGDHRQLPPTIKNIEAAKKGLGTTLFEHLAGRYGEKIMDILTVQYRMHEKIMNFSNHEFYNGELTAHSSVRFHTLKDIGFKNAKRDENLRKILDPKIPIVFIDTKELDAPERTRPGSTSKENRREAKIVVGIAENLLKGGLTERDVAVISPYDDQVALIGHMIDREDLEIKTVDGFQGREKEAIVISLVRSNKSGDVGFLKDLRRLNVTLTRAKRKLIVVGDSSTVSSEKIYGNFLEYVKKRGRYISMKTLIKQRKNRTKNMENH
ncbi:MAG: IGHMBP2 family helicase [Euryarchaeota archaeon]|nr:IGHMBP2 family helicase [Euryarchaeota archaeon]